ncbi:amidohydrolase family-domain-containing protein [Armillaria luteobubalina]|uniref:Amidohydrolase family-domain-containing protein n=1 Tax=Armillaria luteobubalina TaxID=153913 RepID=A0AA39ULN4_9AGAR|nr:amidohydrolase family-domain-containing protein [Armillaria luteobubalina]
MDTALQKSLNTGCALDCCLIVSYTGQQQIWTGDSGNHWADCMAIHDEHIVAIGPLEDVYFEWNAYVATMLPDKQMPKFSNLGIIELGKNTVIIPGLMNSYINMIQQGRHCMNIDLGRQDIGGIYDVIKVIREFVVGPMGPSDKSECIRGSGWNKSTWNRCIWPTAKDLEVDPIIKGRPIILESENHHAIWVSSTILKDLVRKKLWINHVHSGDIMKDAKGQPTGVFLNGAASIISDIFPITEQEKSRMFSVAARQARRFGMTAVHDPDASSTDLYKKWCGLKEGPLPLRVFATRKYDHNSASVPGGSDEPYGQSAFRLSIRSVHLLAEGGTLSNNQFTFMGSIKKCVKEGWTVVFDRDNEANEIMMSAIEGRYNQVSQHRIRFDNARNLTAEDIHHIRNTNAIACLPSEIDGSALRSNEIKVVLGSDTPFDGLNPLRIFQLGVSTNYGEHAKGKARREDLERHRIQILREMTMNTAFATFNETELGSLEPGKYADFVLISQNVLDPSVSLSSIGNTRVLGTVIGGRVVYGSLVNCFSRADGMLARQYAEEFRSIKLYD